MRISVIFILVLSGCATDNRPCMDWEPYTYEYRSPAMSRGAGAFIEVIEYREGMRCVQRVEGGGR